jgi:hypothetical protein
MNLWQGVEGAKLLLPTTGNRMQQRLGRGRLGDIAGVAA